MRRNSTIIALSDAMIRVESGRTGGTFAAGTECLRRKLPLFVIDFRTPPGPSAEANPEFIRQGGLPIRGNTRGIPNLSRLFQTVNAKAACVQADVLFD
jgi:predicted Rossmann fold nucleotide-binding protein DprA/Smf involved in DNA uptake